MGEIQDFHCTYDNFAGISQDVTKGLGLSFPDAYFHAGTMARLSLAMKEYSGAAFCELPFCHTVEAEALGGMINYGDERFGPRAGGYRYTDVEELLELPEIDFSSGRIREVLGACRILREQGEHVVLEVSGPFTILNSLIDAGVVFRGLRRKPEIMRRIFEKLGGGILQFMEEAKRCQVDLISYADSSGGVNILGPKLAAQIAEEFTWGFLKRAEALTDDRLMILLCPKTALALTGIGKAVFEAVRLPGPVRYGEACIQMIGKTAFAGQMCMKNVNYILDDGVFQRVILR